MTIQQYQPIVCPKIWGAERWLISPYGDARTLTIQGEDALGDYPLLIKHITARDDLSLQVHPDDNYARAHGLPNGKTEMWYVTRAARGAQIIMGIDACRADAPDIGIERYRKVPVKRGDVCFIPAGRVHALGSGVEVLEIQQSSDATYRLFDYGRMGADGKPRPLHIKDARAVMESSSPDEVMTVYNRKKEGVTSLVKCDAFNVRRIYTSEQIQVPIAERSAIICVRGECVVRSGEQEAHLCEPSDALLLLPQGIEQLTIQPLTRDAELLLAIGH